jgi:sugar lactone lactonase YvrE
MRRPDIVLLAATFGLLHASSVFGQNYAISTFAGGLPLSIQGTSDGLYGPQTSVAVDKNGNVFFTDLNDVLRLDPKTGIVTLVAGTGTGGYTGDNGPATNAQLSGPAGVAVDSAGNVYIADSGNNVIREVSNGIITTVAGNGSYTFGGDNGPATSAGLNGPYGVAVDNDGNLYIADTFHNRVREVVNGVINTIAGNGTQSFGGDNGPAINAELYLPQAVAVDSAGNVYIADTYNNRIREVSNKIINTIAGTGTQPWNGDSIPAITANLNLPSGVAVDGMGHVYIADAYNRRIREVTAGNISTVAGNGMYGFSGDNGPALDAEFGVAWAVAVDSAGTLYVADFINDRIRKVESGTITTVVGTATPGFSGDNGPPISAELNLPGGVAVDSTGVYIADTANNRIRKVVGGVITTIAGNGTPGYSGDNNTATSAQLQGPEGIALDSHGNLYIADTGNNVVRKVSNGTIFTVFGNGTAGAGTTELDGPSGVAVDSNNSLYIADYNNNRVLELTAGDVFTVASSFINGLNGPAAVAVDSHNHLYIADRGNNRILEISFGVTSTVAGGLLFSPLSSPDGVAVDSTGNIYIVDAGHNMIKEETSGGLITIAGNGEGFAGDGGPATTAAMNVNSNDASGIALDSTGNIYFDDNFNNRIRLLTPAGTTAQTITFNALNNQLLSEASFGVGAIATSGLPVSFESNNTPVCTVSGTTVSLLTNGYCSLTATQLGNATTYAPATPVTQGFYVTPVTQTIGFGPLNNAVLGSGPINLVALVSSGLTVGFASNTKPVCTVSGSTLTLLTAGMCSITASQGGNAVYAPAAVTQTFMVIAKPPSIVSLSPNSGAGTSVTFKAIYADPMGTGDLSTLLLQINTSQSSANACYVYYQPQGNHLYLANNAGAWITPALTPGVAGMASNSQCTLNAGSSSVATAGNDLTLSVALSFTGTFINSRNVYLYAAGLSGLNTGWVKEGSWVPTNPGPPAIVSLSPNTGAGTAVTFKAIYSDPDGAGDLSTVLMQINAVQSSGNACYVYYQPQGNHLYLANNAGAWITPALTPGVAGTASNSQCTLNAASSSVATAGNDLTLNVALTFTGTFVGTKNVYLYAAALSGQNSGWIKEGSWVPTNPGPPAIVSLSPNTGTGTSVTFKAIYSDPIGAGDLNEILLQVNTSQSGANACYVYYQPQGNHLYLSNNAGTAWMTPALTPGVAGTASNSQCTLNAASSSVGMAGNDLTLNVALSFSGTFVGLKHVYLYAAGLSGQNSGWIAEGTWMP